MITYTKLRSGDWGLRATGVTLVPGRQVAVTKKSGGTSTVCVGEILWTGDGVTLATIRQEQRSSTRSGGSVCAECGRGGRLVADLEDGLLKHYGCCDIPPGGY